MKNRDYKEFTKGGIYHVYNRGVEKSDIFLNEENYKLFLFRLKENLFPKIRGSSSHKSGVYVRKNLPAGAFDLICYCLMPNHFHFLIQQKTDLPISKLISKLCTGYSMVFNKKNGRVGGLFQDQFKAVLIDSNKYLSWVSFYIHNNPKEAKLVKNLNEWQWSSYLDYIGERGGTLCNKEIILGQLIDQNKYKQLTEESQNKIENDDDIEPFLLD